MGQHSKFADLRTVLATITPPLLEQGLVLTQTLEGQDLITTLRHVGGESIESRCPLIEASGKNALHMWGAAVTYQRRYAIQSLLCLAAEDDDGDSAGHKMKHATTASSDDFL